ncbi:hypothetical protein BACCIP111895_03111 [Neobacillus rhizosphaerae]|uniref:Uncharacterized protein n=1 Tax=Neobacillus rhizosphaerae TaxID=2880965 RepID=A0ABM9ETE6_9BACI|nr:hypothetical protein BACCIP111895_03111 [Neobacillus rhizosphaerae]
MRWFLAILFILLGAFLFLLTIDDIGNLGHIIMKIIGFGCFFCWFYCQRQERTKQTIILKEMVLYFNRSKAFFLFK